MAKFILKIITEIGFIQGMSFSPNYNTSNTENEFYILVWKMTKNNSSTPPYYNIPNWNICELYGKHFHVNYEGTDIYFKKR